MLTFIRDATTLAYLPHKTSKTQRLCNIPSSNITIRDILFKRRYNIIRNTKRQVIANIQNKMEWLVQLSSDKKYAKKMVTNHHGFILY